jgi:hypothetical protein
MQVEMLFESEKKHSVRYNANPAFNDPCVTSVYVMKSALSRPFPKKFLLTITTGPEED